MVSLILCLDNASRLILEKNPFVWQFVGKQDRQSAWLQWGLFGLMGCKSCMGYTGHMGCMGYMGCVGHLGCVEHVSYISCIGVSDNTGSSDAIFQRKGQA